MGECVWQAQWAEESWRVEPWAPQDSSWLEGFGLCSQAPCCKWGSPLRCWQVRYSKCLSKVNSQNQAFDNTLWHAVGNKKCASWPSNKEKHIQEAQLSHSYSKGRGWPLLISGWQQKGRERETIITCDQKIVKKKIKQGKSLSSSCSSGTSSVHSEYKRQNPGPENSTAGSRSLPTQTKRWDSCKCLPFIYFEQTFPSA